MIVIGLLMPLTFMMQLQIWMQPTALLLLLQIPKTLRALLKGIILSTIIVIVRIIVIVGKGNVQVVRDLPCHRRGPGCLKFKTSELLRKINVWTPLTAFW